MFRSFKLSLAFKVWLFVFFTITQLPTIAQTALPLPQPDEKVQQYRQHLKTRLLYPKKSIYTDNAKRTYNPQRFAENKAILQQTAAQLLPELQNKPDNVAYRDPKTSLSEAKHYNGVQLWNGTEVYGSHIQASINKKGELYLFNALVFDCKNLKQIPNTQQPINYKAIEQFLTDKGRVILPQNNVSMPTTLFFAAPDKAYWAVKVNAETPDHHDYRQFVFAADGQLLYHRDLTHRCSPKLRDPKDKQETNIAGQGYVFDPDPLTTAQKQYGATAEYRDNNDADNNSLNAQRVVRDIEVSFFNGNYVLENSHFKIVEYEAPVVEPVRSTSTTFNYTRSESGFEDVNAFYHANTMYNYIHSLGFTQMDDQLVWIDTHAENGIDQSRHRYAGNKHIITHGEGGVDDAEDADVIVHEFAHAISFSACNDCNAGFEREALDEAICDYFATTYSRRISEYRWQDMFTWDGHNPYFTGRNMNNNFTYPNDIDPDSIYPTSEIFSPPLMDIWEAIGRETTDRIMLEALHNFTPGIGLDDAAEIVIQADQQLNGGNNYDVLCYWFSLRGLYNGTCEYVLDAGQDQNICIGDTITLGGNTIPPTNGQIYWTPNISLNDSTAIHPIAMPDGPTNYVLTLIDNAQNITLHDTVFVNAQYCIDNASNTEVQLLNTLRFMQGRGDLIVLLPEDTQNAQVNIFAATGQAIGKYAIPNNTQEYIIIDSANLSNGLYMIEVKADGIRHVFKAAKAR